MYQTPRVKLLKQERYLQKRATRSITTVECKRISECVKVFSSDAGKPYCIEDKQTGDWFLIAHGSEDGSIFHADKVRAFINKYPDKKIQISICYPRQVKQHNPDLADFIIGDWDSLTWNYWWFPIFIVYSQAVHDGLLNYQKNQ